MPKGFFKFKLLLDENMPPKNRFPRLNNRFDLRHVIHDIKLKQGTSDKNVFELAKKDNFIILTFNYKHFQIFKFNNKSGLIGLSTNLSIEKIDQKINSLLSKTNRGEVFGKKRFLS